MKQKLLRKHMLRFCDSCGLIIVKDVVNFKCDSVEWHRAVKQVQSLVAYMYDHTRAAYSRFMVQGTV
ncbi:hypothetical protein DFQ01_12385 [Paenibacillus cellulosilyticus]|uniref:Uncharacterized protein n=1 Tax=Paenibacillus cellulosilyticus TaxID=375489 RepID=A0A2V2YN48_9BACL|nr:hypothetical protein DFQ01_12385 [Paenibacillus cellulosilyticus]